MRKESKLCEGSKITRDEIKFPTVLHTILFSRFHVKNWLFIIDRRTLKMMVWYNYKKKRGLRDNKILKKKFWINMLKQKFWSKKFGKKILKQKIW